MTGLPASWELFLVVTAAPVAGLVACLVAARLPLRRPDS